MGQVLFLVLQFLSVNVILPMFPISSSEYLFYRKDKREKSEKLQTK